MKEYIIVWLDDDGAQHNLGTVETNNPQNVLFNKTCEMVCSYSKFYDPKKPDNIRKWIEKGKTEREHYFVECNGNALSIMEADFKCEG